VKKQMADFKSALKAGIDNAEIATKAKQEIAEVIRAVDAAVRDLTGQKVSIDIQPRQAGAPSTGIGISFTTKRGPYYAIMAVPGSGSNASIKKELARWEMPDRGYPCIVEFSDGRFTCEGKDGLERVLIMLLKAPATADAITEVRNSTTL
jgi:hypothetical protein